MKRPAIFFDRDNTLIFSDGYLGDPEKVTLMDGAADAIARARSLGFATVVISNQSGVARGMFGEDDVHAVNRRLDELLLAGNSAAVIDRHEFCPFHPEASVEKYRQDSVLRKPGPGMIFEAADKLALDLTRSWMIGDAPRDIEAGHRAGCRTILLTLPEGTALSPAASAKLNVPPDTIVQSLGEAIDFIEKNMVESEPAISGSIGPEPAAPAAPETSISMRLVAARVPQDSLPSSGPILKSSSDDQDDSQPAGAAQSAASARKLEQLAEQILSELRKRNESASYNTDFSVSKLMAGIAQVTALAVLFVSYLYRNDPTSCTLLMLFAIFVQTLTVALLIMGRQK